MNCLFEPVLASQWCDGIAQYTARGYDCLFITHPLSFGIFMVRYSLDEEFRFGHHTFAKGEVPGEAELIAAEKAIPVLDPKPEEFSEVAVRLRDAGVRNILLIHGTFAGGDITGLVRELKRFSPVRATRVHQLSKAWFDEMVGDVGNYTDRLATRLNTWLNVPDQGGSDSNNIKVDRFGWSGENHHIGRIDGAVALLRKISEIQLMAGYWFLLTAMVVIYWPCYRRFSVQRSTSGNLSFEQPACIITVLFEVKDLRIGQQHEIFCWIPVAMDAKLILQLLVHHCVTDGIVRLFRDCCILFSTVPPMTRIRRKQCCPDRSGIY